ncbi:MAG: Gfo/Idh/MocA family oxidoreductase [Bacteroidaceae bacterium]|nr:Gfo/Idh/MocA family oxidoreductase [Bacteroidaceae bacterium]MBR3896025.1 Gfo/Idh/MocA family oxidoreductase [Bacteroidaceae bacterium]
MIQQLIDRYKRLRTERFLAQTYQYSYAFVGMGQHSLTNLYPVLHYLGVPLKYICVTSDRKALLIERKFPQVKATTSLDDILADDAVKGVLVSTSPVAHFSIASRVLQSGKSLFMEKPPCQTLQELDALIDKQRLYGSPIAMVGLQKRYAPAVQILQKRLRKEHLNSYDLHYLTGAYPEGNALLDLYIHPLDLVCFLFGTPDIIACQQVAPASYILMLRHPHIIGTLELSTSYTWTSAEESLKVCTSKGIYCLSQMEQLTFEPKPSTIFGVPYEKIQSENKTVEYLYARNNFTPTLLNNQIYLQGYYNEILSFITSVEHEHSSALTDIATVKPTYEILMGIESFLKNPMEIHIEGNLQHNRYD